MSVFDEMERRSVRIGRFVFAGLGVLLVVIGIVGAFLPLLPSTIFFILAAGCFARSSPALEAWLLSHPVAGPGIRAWREHGAISRNGKLLALGGMTTGYLVFLASARPGPALSLGVALVMLACAGFVASRPTMGE